MVPTLYTLPRELRQQILQHCLSNIIHRLVLWQDEYNENIDSWELDNQRDCTTLKRAFPALDDDNAFVQRKATKIIEDVFVFDPNWKSKYPYGTCALQFEYKPRDPEKSAWTQVLLLFSSSGCPIKISPTYNFNMPKTKAPAHHFNTSRSKSKSKSKVEKRKCNNSITQTTLEMATNTSSANKSTIILLTLPRELRQQILHHTFTERIEYEISWYGSLHQWENYGKGSFYAIEIWANNLRLACPALIDDINYVEGHAIGAVRQAGKGFKIEWVRVRRW